MNADERAEWSRKAREALPNGMPRYVANFQVDEGGRTVTEWVESPWAAYFD